MLFRYILPQERRFVRIKNPEERLDQYMDSLKFYIINTNIRKIVFCDNSGYGFNKEELYLLADRNHKEVEIIQFIGDKNSIEKYGKGYGEGELVKYALENSRLLEETDYFIKVTGRLKVRNINIIKNKIDLNKIYFNKNVGEHQLMDTVIYCIPKKIYIRYFMNAYKQVCDSEGRYIEQVFKDIIYSKDLKIYNTPSYPFIEGFSGSTGDKYQKNIGKERKIYNLLSKWNLLNASLVNWILYKCL